MRVNPETYIVEGAEGNALTRRPHLPSEPPNRQGLPGARAHIETPRERTEQERPIGNRGKAGAGGRGETGAPWGERPVGVGLSHSSEEPGEGGCKPTSGGSEGESRVEEVARRKPEAKFTSLAHYLTVALLGKAYEALEADAAPGVDGVTKKECGRDLERRPERPSGAASPPDGPAEGTGELGAGGGHQSVFRHD